MSLNRTGVITNALEVLKAGLEGGAIKLQGSSMSNENNALAIKNDSAYLNGLLNSIVENIIEQIKH